MQKVYVLIVREDHDDDYYIEKILQVLESKDEADFKASYLNGRNDELRAVNEEVWNEERRIPPAPWSFEFGRMVKTRLREFVKTNYPQFFDLLKEDSFCFETARSYRVEEHELT